MPTEHTVPVEHAVPMEHTAAEASRLLASGACSSLQLTAFYLARIARIDPRVKSVLALAPDALASAAASDMRRRNDDLLGPLDGIPILIKDNIETVGLPGTAGSRALLESPVVADAPLVGRLRAAGLVVLGAANFSEWANFRSTGSTSGWSGVGGQTVNPFDVLRNPSGSSSGSAAAVAAGLAPLAIGTETDGSIVSPAGHCGLVGFKPTIGTVPGAGIVPISPVQDTAGPMVRSVADAAALYSVLADRESPVLDGVSLAGRRIAVWRPAEVPASVAAVLDAVSAVLASAGAVPVPFELPVTDEPKGPFEDAEFDALVGDFAVALPAYLASRSGPHPRTWPDLLAFNRADEVELSKFSDEIFGLAATVDPAQAAAARLACDARAASELAAVLGDCDFAIAPTNAPAQLISYNPGDHSGVSTSSLCAITGAPSITLPGYVVDGLPVGISLLARHNQDLELLAWALAVETLLPRIDYPEL